MKFEFKYIVSHKSEIAETYRRSISQQEIENEYNYFEGLLKHALFLQYKIDTELMMEMVFNPDLPVQYTKDINCSCQKLENAAGVLVTFQTNFIREEVGEFLRKFLIARNNHKSGLNLVVAVDSEFRF